ncbi:MAG: glutamate 5-kinase, partial [Armatimonadota bacterium]
MSYGSRKRYLEDVHRLVVKVGTRVVLRGERVDDECLGAIAGEMSDLRRAGMDVLLVTSGAVGLGLTALGLHRHVDDVSKKQAAAAVGQSLLMQHYRELFGRHDQTVAQILLTHGDIADRARYLHIRNTLLTLLEAGVIPIVNENDTVSVAGVTFGENDKLAALVASKIGADLLVFLSSADGLYTADPRIDRAAQLIRTVGPG